MPQLPTTRLALLVAAAMIVSGCSSVQNPEGADVPGSVTTATTDPARSSSTLESSTTTVATTTATTEPPIPELVTQTVGLDWSQPQFVAELDAITIVGVRVASNLSADWSSWILKLG